MDKLVMETVSEAERKARLEARKKVIAEIVPTVSGFNRRVVDDPQALDQLAWLLEILGWSIKMNAPIEGRLVEEKLDREGIKKFFVELMAVVPALRLEKATEETPPEAWVWKEFNGRPIHNPWSDPVNLTDQSWITKHDPKRAAFLKLEASGGPTYQQLHEERERKRQIAEANSYEGPNPFKVDNEDGEQYTMTQRLLDQASIKKANSYLAERLMQEAKVGFPINPFSEIAPNMTLQMLVLKSNVGLANLMKTAARFQQAQAERELRDARDAAASAQLRAADASNRAKRMAGRS